jgi:transcriptional regulator with XRE-family HTH domain
VTDLYGATVAKRRLSRLLTELRIKNGYTANQVCDKLNWGRGKVGRFEANVWKRPEMSDIRDLLRIYEVSETERQELEDLAVLARGRAWWREYGDVFGDSEYPGYEADAARISVYMPLILPGLLQTPAYIEAHMLVGSQPAPWRRRALEARLRRQQILELGGGSAPELVAVITEASLMYRWGTQAERRAQVAHLVEMARRPHIELRMLRFADGPHPGMSSLISIFDFPGDEPGMVYLENDAMIQEVSGSAEVDAYAAIFERIREVALNVPATTARLKQLAETLE